MSYQIQVSHGVNSNQEMGADTIYERDSSANQWGKRDYLIDQALEDGHLYK